MNRSILATITLLTVVSALFGDYARLPRGTETLQAQALSKQLAAVHHNGPTLFVVDLDREGAGASTSNHFMTPQPAALDLIRKLAKEGEDKDTQVHLITTGFINSNPLDVEDVPRLFIAERSGMNCRNPVSDNDLIEWQSLGVTPPNLGNLKETLTKTLIKELKTTHELNLNFESTQPEIVLPECIIGDVQLDRKIEEISSKNGFNVRIEGNKRRLEPIFTKEKYVATLLKSRKFKSGVSINSSRNTDGGIHLAMKQYAAQSRGTGPFISVTYGRRGELGHAEYVTPNLMEFNCLWDAAQATEANKKKPNLLQRIWNM